MKGTSVTGSVALFVTHTSSAWAERICSVKQNTIEGGERNREGGMGRICKDFKEEVRNQRNGIAEGF